MILAIFAVDEPLTIWTRDLAIPVRRSNNHWSFAGSNEAVRNEW